MFAFQTHTYQSTTLQYYLSHPNPKILISSGFHGDEGECIPYLTQCVEQYQDKLPPFLYVPVASPSAISQKTRVNAFGHDINRSYTLNTTDEEAAALMDLLTPYAFDTVITVHEDPQAHAFYLYDLGKPFDKAKLDELFRAVAKDGIQLFTGIDDEEDPTLGLQITNGYIWGENTGKNESIVHGFFSEYLGATGKTIHYLCPEIPGKLAIEQKNNLVNHLMQTLI